VDTEMQVEERLALKQRMQQRKGTYGLGAGAGVEERLALKQRMQLQIEV